MEASRLLLLVPLVLPQHLDQLLLLEVPLPLVVPLLLGVLQEPLVALLQPQVDSNLF